MIKRIGFFHFGENNKADPVGSLEEQVAKHSPSALKESLIVLPEAFNSRGGLYQSTPELDPQALPRLRAVSTQLGLVFVAGLVEGIGGPNSAFLIDGDNEPVLLSRKRCGGWDPLYKASPQADTSAVINGEVGITALVCDDAVRAGQVEHGRAEVIARVMELGAGRSVLCVPAFMTITESRGTARLWAKSITVVLANGCNYYPSVILHDGQEHTSQHYIGENRIELCDLWYSVLRWDGERNDADLEKCIFIIRSGGAVNVDKGKLRRATALALAKKGTEIVGVGSMKGIRREYAAGIATRSGFPLMLDTPELGYVAVGDHDKGNGLSHRLVAELLRDQTGAVFATTDDLFMKRTLGAAGFIQRGREWEGNRGQLSLWIRN